MLILQGSCPPKSSNLMFVYVNLKRSHWVLLRINRLEKSGIVFDSSSRPTSHGQCQHLFDYLVKYLFGDKKKWKFETSNLVKQQGDHECGVICMLHLKKNLFDPDLIIDTSNITQERKKLALQILNEKL